MHRMQDAGHNCLNSSRVAIERILEWNPNDNDTSIGTFTTFRIDVGQPEAIAHLPAMGRSSAPGRRLARIFIIGYPPML